MARVQVQAPEIQIVQPAARPTDQFVQAKFIPAVPKDLLELQQFSETLTGFLRSAHEDQVKSDIKLGESIVALGRPFGEPIAGTPQETANRKATEALVDRGDLLRSNSPYVRLGMAKGEAMRAAMNAGDHVMSEQVLASMSSAIDNDGNLNTNPLDIDAEFDRLIQPFLKVPALQNEYARRVAGDMINGLRAQFHTTVSQRRDAAYMEYHETETTNQLSGYMGQLAMLKADTTPDGMKLYADAQKGLDLFRKTTVLEGGFAENRKVAIYQNAARAFILNRAKMGQGTEPAENALKAIDLVRSFQVGSTTIAEDSSAKGIVFRELLERWENEYTEDEIRLADRADKMRDLERENLTEAFKAQLGEQDWTDARDTKNRMDILARQGGTNATLFLGLSKERFDLESQAIAEDPAVADEVELRMNREGAKATIAWLETLGETKAIPGTQMGVLIRHVRKVDASISSQSDIPQMEKDARAHASVMIEGKDTPARGALNRAVTDIILAANSEIMSGQAALAANDAPGKAKVVKDAFANATTKIDAMANGLLEKEKELRIKQWTFNERGDSVHDDIHAAVIAGAITPAEGAALDAADRLKSSVRIYTDSQQLTAVADQAIKANGLDGTRAGSVGRLAKFEMRQLWIKNRAGMSPQQFEEFAFNWIDNELPTILGKAAGSKEFKTGLAANGLLSIEERVATGAIADLNQGAAFDLDHSNAGSLVRALNTHRVGSLGRTWAIHEAAQAVYSVPKESKIETPKSVERFAQALGRNPANVKQARIAAAAEFAKVENNPAYKTDGQRAAARRALLSTGFATLEELAAGVVGGVQLQPGDVPQWTTQFFPDLATMKSLEAKSGGAGLEATAARHGILIGDMEAWVSIQAKNIEISEVSELQAMKNSGLYEWSVQLGSHR